MNMIKNINVKLIVQIPDITQEGFESIDLFIKKSVLDGISMTVHPGSGLCGDISQQEHPAPGGSDRGKHYRRRRSVRLR